jgi:hypothetical protein
MIIFACLFKNIIKIDLIWETLKLPLMALEELEG